MDMKATSNVGNNLKRFSREFETLIHLCNLMNSNREKTIKTGGNVIISAPNKTKLILLKRNK